MGVLHLITSLMIIYGMGVRGFHGVYTPCQNEFGQYGEYIISIEFKFTGEVILIHQKRPLGPKKVYTCKYHFIPRKKESYLRVVFEGPECDKLLEDSKGYLNPYALQPSITLDLKYLYMVLPSPGARALYKDRKNWECPA
ncbi:hypothetical protein Pmar_PMAR026963 [Perkinsus marinus ATCC 50983]|uniref:Uncharacterized protein n=1 Tax=Perkinsus marinus (strain ATCC 50983 / TXsc) TaxID=423536 RepID=C5LE83_PERM5|nr:hypothetical protein Pmar_PMAR026963 [Perkinsus marinus ATCC 50983]EER04951.1 hypothetical protein Pmar_PMAR026963 [Perkinsus marinus ATCC 50983]|eukprot:XP_002773135.1 hypothetical protein Pmar_PMAR026963 [Perkinsus marinus ATCC 50983]